MNSVYTVNDVPNETWTIQQLLDWRLLQSQHQTNQKRDESINFLRKELELGKEQVMELHKMALAVQQEQDDNQQSNVSMPITNNDENQDVNIPVETKKDHQAKSSSSIENSGLNKGAKTNLQMASTVSSSTQQAPKTHSSSIEINIISGPHKGSTYNLEPLPRKPCFVGRSAGKKFRERGISLPQDSEVSTTHGKFEKKGGNSNGKMYFTDTGSTNGTLVKGEELEDNEPLELAEGMELTIGSSVLKVISLSCSV